MRALESGFTTIWVSNHGGRQLDTRNGYFPFFVLMYRSKTCHEKYVSFIFYNSIKIIVQHGEILTGN